MGCVSFSVYPGPGQHFKNGCLERQVDINFVLTSGILSNVKGFKRYVSSNLSEDRPSDDVKCLPFCFPPVMSDPVVNVSTLSALRSLSTSRYLWVTTGTRW